MLLELPDAAGGIAVLADGTRVYWGVALGNQLVAKRPDGTTNVLPPGGDDPTREAFVGLCDRGASITRPLKSAEVAELHEVVEKYGPTGAATPGTPADEPEGDEPSGKLVYRVFALPDGLRDAVRDARTRTGLTNRAFVAEAVAAHVGTLVSELTKLGFGRVGGPTRPARLPFSPEAGTLDALRRASGEVGVPASHLLLLCLAAASVPDPPPTKTPGERRPRRGGRRK
ncbi:MAG: hypothetical protein U0871_07140 [Gemmataceae bacterium]